MLKGLFVTGTDTGVGKTQVSLGLMARLQQQGYKVQGMKPVASGCEKTVDGLRNEDALLLQQQSNSLQPYDTINPYAFAPAIAPHLAASEVGVRIDIQNIHQRAQELQQSSDQLIVEGAGGWLVPLNAEQTMADLARALRLPVVLVVGMRLGCINHALLTAESIRASGCELFGWVANHIEENMEQANENERCLEEQLGEPMLARVPWLGSCPSAKDILNFMPSLYT